MEYRNSNDNNKLVVINQYTKQELLALIKTQVKIVIKFMLQDDKGTLRPDKHLWLYERFIYKGEQKINVALDEKGLEVKKISYDKLMEIFDSYMKEKNYLVNVTCFKQSFMDNLPLLKHVNEFNEEQIAGAISLSYNNGYYSFKFKSQNNKPEEVYFWPSSKTLFYFSANTGPTFMYKTSINNVSDLIREMQ